MALTKVTDGVCCGDERINALLNKLEAELLERLLSQRNLGDVFRQRFLHQVMTRMFPRGF